MLHWYLPLVGIEPATLMHEKPHKNANNITILVHVIKVTSMNQAETIDERSKGNVNQYNWSAAMYDVTL